MHAQKCKSCPPYAPDSDHKSKVLAKGHSMPQAVRLVARPFASEKRRQPVFGIMLFRFILQPGNALKWL